MTALFSTRARSGRNASIALVGGAVSLLTLASTASANVYAFTESCTNNVAGDVAIGLAQLSVEVTNPGSGFIDFTFRNTGPAASSITDLYWDDGALLGIALIIPGPGTSFSTNAAPPNLPGGETLSPPFVATAGFTADSNPPAQPNGVNPGEFVTVRFSLIGGFSYADAINQLNDGTVRIGVHVQGFATGNSESFVIVPTPGALAIGVLGSLVAFRRRR